MIISYLKELLNDNDCVIVPGFGAFISKRHSATIDYANHRFLPPYKEIVFNNKLNNNDGVLVDFIASKENVSKEEALSKIQSFVNQSMAVLDVNSELELPSFGKFININGNYIFNVKDDINLLGDSFGLTEFTYQPVFRTETYQIIKERIVVEQKEKNTEYTVAIESVEPVQNTEKSRSILRPFVSAVAVFALLFLINWGTVKSDSNMASWNPFMYSSPNEYFLNLIGNQDDEVAEVLTAEVVTPQLVETEIQEIVEAEIPETAETNDILTTEIETSETQEVAEVSAAEVVEAETPEVVEVEVEVKVLEVKEIHYYIVGGSFQAEASAEKCLANIKRQGFVNAAVLEKNAKGYIRVYYESFAEKSEALLRLDAIKKEYNESAWLLFQK